MFELDPVFLSRIQFAFTISFHIIFPAFTIGLASFLAVIEWRWLVTKDTRYRDIYKLWVKIFSVAFGMGVVSGVVMSYQFGTNWSLFSDKIGNVLGPLLGYEVLTAFFLEASFLGIMLFGWGRVSPGMHFFATLIVAIGTMISAFWIISANSWMHTPAGYFVDGEGRLHPTNWLDIIFNPSFPYRYAHMMTAAYLTTAFVIGGVGAFYLRTKQHVSHAKIMLSMAVLMTSIAAPAQFFIGHEHGINTMEHQPAKIAAMEGNWDHTNNAPLYLFGLPNQEREATEYGITIPNGASFMLTGSINGAIPNLKSFVKDDRPPVMQVFWCFRIMVGIGLLMILISLTSAIQYFRSKLFDNRFLQLCWIFMIPMGFIAILAGWFVTEIGRQPWIVYGVMRTIEVASPYIGGEQVLWSLISFVIMYTCIFGAGSYYILKLIRKGIIKSKEEEKYYEHSLEASFLGKTGNIERK